MSSRGMILTVMLNLFFVVVVRYVAPIRMYDLS